MNDQLNVGFDGREYEVIYGSQLHRNEYIPDFDYYSWPNFHEWAKADYPSQWADPTDGRLQDVGWDKEFVRYDGEVIDLSDILRTDVPGWDGIRTDSFFSGILVRYARVCYCTSADGEAWCIHGNMCPIGDEMDTDLVFVARYWC